MNTANRKNIQSILFHSAVFLSSSAVQKMKRNKEKNNK